MYDRLNKFVNWAVLGLITGCGALTVTGHLQPVKDCVGVLIGIEGCWAIASVATVAISVLLMFFNQAVKR
jgi:hypothetical protein